MLNLLIISNNLKAESIRKKLQPMLKAKIDVMGDFDLGLKEVFEKRPAVVVIQDHISAVSAENVAHHIQMLLGENSPVFILMHDGNNSVKKVNGLFDHLLDLSLPAKPFFADLMSKLKVVYGKQWEKVLVAGAWSDNTKPDSEETSLLSLDAVTGLAGELLHDLQAENADMAGEVVSQPIAHSTAFLATQTEEVAALQAEKPDFSRSAPLAPESPKAVKANGNDKYAEKEMPVARVAVLPLQDSDQKQAAVLNLEEKAVPRSVNRVMQQPENDVAGAALSDMCKVSEDILLSFEKNYHADSTHWKTVAVVASIIVCTLVGVWYLLNSRPNLQSVLKKQQPAQNLSVTQPVNTAISNGTPPGANLQKPVSSVTVPIQKQKTVLPSFVIAADRDLSFTGNMPGWERYLNGSYDIRLFRTEGRLKAIQVLAVKGKSVSESFLKNVLREVVGSDRYTPLSVHQKHGFILQRYSLGQGGELLIYRNTVSKTINAFVASVD